MQSNNTNINQNKEDKSTLSLILIIVPACAFALIFIVIYMCFTKRKKKIKLEKTIPTKKFYIKPVYGLNQNIERTNENLDNSIIPTSKREEKKIDKLKCAVTEDNSSLSDRNLIRKNFEKMM